MADRNGYIGRAPSDSAVQVARQDYTPTGVQTNFTFVAGYTPGYLDVYLNGSKLVVAQDFTATDGSVVGLTSAAASGDIIELVAFKAFNAASVSNAGTFNVSGNQTNDGTLSVTGGTTLSNLNVTGISTFGTVSSLDLNGGVLTLDADGDTTITADTDDQIDIAFGGNDRLTLSTGLIDLKNDGSQSAIRLYCESSNAHYAALQAPAHSAFSGNITLTLPATTDTLVARTTTDTLTNKTLTSPTISTPTLTGGVGIADSIFHTGDTNTQLRFPAADTFTVETAGSERIRVDSSGNVAIGTATAGGTLHVENSGELNAFFEGSASTLGARILLKNNNNTANAYNDIEGVDAGGQGTSAIRFINVNDGNNEGALAIRTRASGGSMAEALRIDSSGRVLIGGTSSQNQYGSQSHLQVQGTGFNDSTIALRRDENNANPPGVIFAKSRAGSIGGNTIVQDDDQIGSLLFAAADGTDLTSLAAEIRVEIDGTPGGNDVPGRIVLRTTADGAASPTERLHITSGGNVRIGSFGAPSNKNTVTPLAHVDGSGVNGSLQVNRHTSPGGGGSQLILSATRGSSITGHTILQDDDGMGTIEFSGSDGGEFVTGARIQAAVDGTPGDDDLPSRLLFSTTSDGGSSPTEAMRIDSRQRITAKAGAIAEIDTLTSASTVTPDFAASCNFTLTLGTDVTLANPSNLTAGQSGSIFLVQDGTGSRTITFGSQYDFAGGTAPTLSTAASSVDRLDYFVRTSSSIHCVVTLAYS